VEVPSAPSDLKAGAKAKGIELSWEKPSDAKHDLPGYNVYRRGEKESEDALAAPINTSPVSTTTYTDTPAYGTFTYVVRAVASTGAPRIESEPSAPVTATFKDLTPPPAPATMNALIETHAVRLVWDPVTATDLAGYMLYREEGVGHAEQAGGIKSVGVIDLIHHLINTTTYVDPDALLGISYRYAVTAIDKNGNESERVWTPWVTVPKTP
jgi:fibronectin type 3 domain-containing protein